MLECVSADSGGLYANIISVERDARMLSQLGRKRSHNNIEKERAEYTSLRNATTDGVGGGISLSSADKQGPVGEEILNPLKCITSYTCLERRNNNTVEDAVVCFCNVQVHSSKMQKNGDRQ